MNSEEKEQSLKLAEHYFRNNNYTFAQQILDKVIKEDLNNSKANELLAYIYGNLGQFDISFDLLTVASNQNDCSPEALYYLGSMELKRSLFTEAIKTFKKSILKGGEVYEVLHDLATAQARSGDLEASLDNYQKCLKFGELSFELFFNIARTFDELKRYDEALAHYDKALSLKPDYVEAWSNKGVTLNELKRFDEAIAHFDKALSLKLEYAEAWVNKGITLNELKRYDESIAHYDKALSLKSNYLEACVNKGVTLHELKRFDQAIAHFDKALSLKSDCHEASWNKSLTLLSQGDFINGLPLYESRWNIDKVSEIAGKRFFDKDIWQGSEPLQDRTILLYGEQGLGDFIQFCRYVKPVSELGAKIILEVPQQLAGLMERLEGISKLVVKGEELPYFDYHCPLLSLPLAFNTTISSIPVHQHYLTSNPNKVAKWKLKLGEKRRMQIGLAWSSMSSFKDDNKRSLKLIDFVKALPTEDFEYICLQKEVKECDKVFLRSYKKIRFFGDELECFTDTAALIENLDLVISTCTSIPHLSGALGKETWILLSHVPDWRWLLDREDSPWYPTVKLYRQSAIGDWNSALDKVKFDLNSIKPLIWKSIPPR